MTKYESFIEDYKALCIKHKATIGSAMYDALELFDLDEDELKTFTPCIDDCINNQKAGYAKIWHE
jgi:hypothetical protein